MLRVVIDTNIIISGIFYGGVPDKILQGLAQGLFKIILTAEIIDEYKEVIERLAAAKKKPRTDNDPYRTLEDIISHADILEVENIITPYCEDPDDIMFLEAAIAGRAKYLVSGDHHLLDVGKYEDGIVIKPRVES